MHHVLQAPRHHGFLEKHGFPPRTSHKLQRDAVSKLEESSTAKGGAKAMIRGAEGTAGARRFCSDCQAVLLSREKAALQKLSEALEAPEAREDFVQIVSQCSLVAAANRLYLEIRAMPSAAFLASARL